MARCLVILIVMCSMFSLNAEAYGAYTLVKDVFSGEGAAAISTSASYKLQGTLGQNPEPGIPRSTNYVIYEGFWNAEGMGVPPAFVDISDKIIYVNVNCGSGVYYIPLEVTDDKTPATELVIGKNSSNQGLIPDDGIEILNNQQIKITLFNKINVNNARITLTATDADGLTASESFKVTVESSPECLSAFVGISDKIIRINENCGSGIYYLYITTDNKTSVAELVMTQDPKVIPDGNIEIFEDKIKIKLDKANIGATTTITPTAIDEKGWVSSEPFKLRVESSSVCQLQDVIWMLQALTGMEKVIPLPENDGKIELKDAVSLLSRIADQKP